VDSAAAAAFAPRGVLYRSAGDVGLGQDREASAVQRVALLRQAFCSFAVAASKAAMAPPAMLTNGDGISLADPAKRIVISPMSVLLQLRCCELGDVWRRTWRAVRSDGCTGRRVRLRVREHKLRGRAAGRRSNDQFGGGLQSQVEHRIICPRNGPAADGSDGDRGPIYTAGLERAGGQGCLTSC
jgi:hypothetical protein